ncbi:hypothetical protein GCM10009775_11090 [Microbacterium aoyamense]|uniref:Htaa domain-containing protein n=1 Tax=Microbacterium aoyamense TaxID=344166 RepID=A0ABP5ASK2_9MICO|nr:hypothetical protein [Microbacterium aoyamense]
MPSRTDTNRSPLTRRLAAVGTVVALAAAGLAFAAPAQAAETQVDDASFTWGLNGYAQKGIFGPWTFKDLTGSTTYLPGATQTEYVTPVFPATSFPANAPSGANPNAVKFTDGEGWVDPVTGAAYLSWTGSYTVNAYPAIYNAPNEIYSNPELSIADDGSGELTFDFTIGAGTDMSGNPFERAEFGRITLATFSAGSISGLDADSFRLSPDFGGVVLNPTVVTNQTTTCTAPSKAGSWPAQFVETLAGNSAGAAVAAHFYSTGCGGNQDLKPALPIDIGFTLAETPTEPEEPGTGAPGDIEVEVPTVTPPSGQFGWAWATESAVDLGIATVSGANFTASGALNDVVVTDTRTGGSAPYSWSISGQVGAFTAGTNTFSGGFLGWSPKVVSGTATQGADVTSTQLGGTGLGVASVLASSNAATSATIGADLALVIPGTTAAGDYKTTLTLTALN